MAVDPIHQFQITRLFTVGHIGGQEIAFTHAFGCSANRVQFGVDALNGRSRAAMTKLGAVEEGTLRRARITWTGRVFDRVIYSVLAEEWPRVRAILEAQMAQRQRANHETHLGVRPEGMESR
jgi:hypothetical protein